MPGGGVTITGDNKEGREGGGGVVVQSLVERKFPWLCQAGGIVGQSNSHHEPVGKYEGLRTHRTCLAEFRAGLLHGLPMPYSRVC